MVNEDNNVTTETNSDDTGTLENNTVKASDDQLLISRLESEVARYHEQEWNRYVKYFTDEKFRSDFSFLQKRSEEFAFAEPGKSLSSEQLRDNLAKLKPYIEADVFSILESRSSKQNEELSKTLSKRAIPFKSNQKTSFAEIFNIFDN